MSRTSAGLWWHCWLLSCSSGQPESAQENSIPTDAQEVSTAAATAGSSTSHSLSRESSDAAATGQHQRRRHPAGELTTTPESRSCMRSNQVNSATPNAATAADAAAHTAQRRRRRPFRLLAAWHSRLRLKHRRESQRAVTAQLPTEVRQNPVVMEAAPRRSSQTPGSAPSQSVCIARHRYSPAESDELSLAPGDCVLVTERSPDGWWRGRRLSRRVSGNCDSEVDEANGATGWFPSNHVAQMSAETEAQAKAAAAGSTAANARVSNEDKSLYRVRALHRFSARFAEELSFGQGELLDIVNEPAEDPDWLMAVSANRQNRGLVPKNYVAMVQQAEANDVGSEDLLRFAEASETALEFAPVEDEANLRDLPFYWGGISRAEADELLMRLARPGQFLIRAGESNPHDLTLMIRAQTKTRNFKIRRMNQLNPSMPAETVGRQQQQHQQQQYRFCYCIGQKQFEDLRDLVSHYTQHPIYRSAVEHCYLGQAFEQQG